MEKILIIVKPKFEKVFNQILLDLMKHENLKIHTISKSTLDMEVVDHIYKEHVDKDWYPEQRKYMMSSDCYICIFETSDVEQIRDYCINAIRPNYANKKVYRENAIHCSETLEDAKRELDNRFFDLLLNPLKTKDIFNKFLKL